MHRPLVAWLAVSIVTALGAGCAPPRARTEVLVNVVAEPGVTAEMRSLVVRVRGGPVGGELLETYTETYRTGDKGGIPSPLVLAIVPADGDVTRIFEAEAEALDTVGGTVAIARARAAFQPGRTIEIRLLLSDRCRGVFCPEGETCDDGRCVPAMVDPGDRDGGVGDAGPIDGSVPVGGDCATDVECDDGVFCNGRETCASGTCIAGPRVLCDDGIDCTTDRCVGTGCVNTADDAACTAGPGGRCAGADGCQYDVCDATTCASTGCETAVCEPPPSTRCVRTSACAAGTACCGGACAPVGCDDGNPCTADLCAETGCIHERMSAVPCSDGNACTAGDTCSDGTCQAGTVVDCDDRNPCTTDSCDPASGCRTSPAPMGTTCEDADACDGVETCLSGTCAEGTPVSCDDAIPCTVDSCGPSGCAHAAMDSLCTMGMNGRCEPSLGGCQYTNCTASTCVAGPCESAFCSGDVCMRTPLCGGGQQCCGGACVATGCNDGNPCTTDSCGGSGCVNAPATGAPCEDGSPCTSGDRCSGSACVAGTGCGDGNPCTDDVCGAGGCTYPARAGSCDDGDGCTVNDRCSGTSCVAGTPMDCEDFNDCTADSCSGGACRNVAVPFIGCSPDDPCATGGRCTAAGFCMPLGLDPCCISC